MSLKEAHLGIQLGLSTAKCFFGICCTGDVAWTYEKCSEIENLILRKAFFFFYSQLWCICGYSFIVSAIKSKGILHMFSRNGFVFVVVLSIYFKISKE